MSRRPLYRKSSKSFWKPLAILALVTAVYWGYRNYHGFSPENLVTESVLQGRTFEADVQEIVSPKYKIKAYWFYDDTNPIVSMSFLFKNAGYATDNADEQGISNLAAELLTAGAGRYDSEAFKEKAAERAIGISFEADKDDFKGALLTTRDNLPKAEELLRLVLAEPRFDEAEVERSKQQLLEALKRQKEQPAAQLRLEMNRRLYGSHPYARNPLGEVRTIAVVDKPRLQKFVKDNLSRQNLVAGVAGAVSREEAENLLDKVFSGLQDSGRINFVRNAEVDFAAGSVHKDYPAAQTLVLKAAPGTERGNEDFYPLFIANHILGGSGLTSRLSQEIREKKGLTYGVYSYLGLDDKSPLLLAGYSASPEKAAEAEELFAQQWQKIGEHGVSAEELEQAKKYLTASYNLRFASITTIAEILTAMQKYNLGLDFLQKRNDYVRRVTLEDVNRTAKKYFDNRRLVSVSLGAGAKE